MADFSRLKGAERPLRQVSTPSGSEGSEAISQVFGRIGQKSIEKAVEINNEKSNASLYNATNQIYRLKNVIQADYQKMPDQAVPLMQAAISDVNNIVANTPMNDADRKRLEYLANNDTVDIERSGLKVASEHAKMQGTIAFATQWPEKLQQINESWKDEKTLNYQFENAQKVLNDAFESGFITLNQRESYVDTLHETINAAREAHEIFEDESKQSAKDFHRVSAKFHGANTFGQVGAPSDEATNFLYSHEVNQRNMSDVMAAMYNDRPVDPLRFMNLSAKERKEVQVTRNVIKDIRATFSSGGSWDAMEAVHKSLDSKKDGLLSTEERAAKAYLDNFFAEFTPDKYLKIVSTTPIGAQATYEHNMQINAVNTNQAYSPEQKELLLRDYDNQYADKMVSAGIAKGIPTDKVMPIPSPVIGKAQGAFSPGGDPMDLVSTMDHYNPRNRVYVAQAMKEPVQKEIAYTVGVLEGKTNNAMRQMLVAANQPGIDWSPLRIGKEGISDMTVKKDVESDKNISRVVEYLSHLPVKPGEERGPSIVKMTTNAVRYMSLRSGDFELGDYEKNIGEWGKEYAKAYDIYNGDSFAFNRKQQPQVSDYEWAALGEYSKSKGYEAMKQKMPTASNVDFMQTQDINPLYVTITPDNYIVAQDQYGNVAFSQPFSQAMLDYAVTNASNKFKAAYAKETSKKVESSLNVKGVPRGFL